MCIFELSKLLMYEFHYDYIKSKNDSISKLLLTDTGSLMYEVKVKLKVKLMMCMKILALIKKCLISVIIQLS